MGKLILRLLKVCLVLCCLFGNQVLAKGEDVNVHPPWVNAIFDKATALDVEDPKLAYQYLIKEIENNPQLAGYDLAFAYAYTARYASYLGLNDESMSYIELAKKAYPNATGSLAIEIYLNEAHIQNSRGKAELALKLLHNAEVEAKGMESRFELIKVYNELAFMYSLNSDDLSALQYYQKVYVEVQDSDDIRQKMLLNVNMASSYNSLHDPQTAYSLNLEAVAYFAQSNMPFDEMNSTYILGHSLEMMERHTEAIQEYRRVYKLAVKLNDELFQYTSLIGLANIYLSIQDIESASTVFEQAKAFFNPNNDVILNLNHYAIEYEIAIYHGDLKRAEQLKVKLESMFSTLKLELNYGWAERINWLNAKYYEARGDLPSALEAFRNAYDMLANNNNSIRELARSRFKVMFDTERTEIAMKLVEQEKNIKQLALDKALTQKRAQWMVIVGFSFIILLVIYSLYRQVRTSRKFYQLANSDALTGIANRRAIMAFALDKMLAQQNQPADLSLIIFDIDHFKRVNDKFGHLAGDEVLIQVTKAVNQYIRSSDKFGRIGGEEFMLVCEGDVLIAENLAQRLRAVIAQSVIEYETHHISITASFGVAQWHSEQALEHVFNLADEALYNAKQNGRDQVKVAQ